MDAAMFVESLGEHKYTDKGNMTKEEIDLTIEVLTEAKKAGQFRAYGGCGLLECRDGREPLHGSQMERVYCVLVI